MRSRIAVGMGAVLVAGCMAAPSPRSFPPLDPVAVEVVGDAPAFEPNTETGYGFMLPAAGLVAGDAAHAWVVGFGEQRGEQELMHLTSSADGTDWQVEGRRVEEDMGVELSPPGPVPATVLAPEAGDGWAMYFSGSRGSAAEGSDIWRATAPTAAGPWTADAEPILARADVPANGSDPFQLDFPAVVRTGTGYLMLFGWSPNRATTFIRSATSDDGIAWTVNDEPAIDLGLCGGFDTRSVAMPRMAAHPDGGWLALYGGFGEDADESMALGIARSTDGVAWSCASTEPVLGMEDIPDSTRLHSYALLGSGESTLLLVESLVDDASELWLAELRIGD